MLQVTRYTRPLLYSRTCNITKAGFRQSSVAPEAAHPACSIATAADALLGAAPAAALVYTVANKRLNWPLPLAAGESVLPQLVHV